MGKVCFKCGIEKEIDNFYIHPQTEDGHLGKCKECCKLYEKLKRIENKEAYRLAAKLRRIENPELLREQERKRTRKKSGYDRYKQWREKYPERYKAHTIVNNAVRDGRLIKPSKCEICGGDFHIHAHHEDYSMPLLVVWLCARCHGQIQ